MMKLFATLAFLALLFCYASAQCTVSLNAVRQGTWVDNGVNRSIWTVTIAAGQLQVSNVFLNIVGDLNQIWEVTLVNGTIYQLPAWRLQIGGISPGQSHVFGFIINNANTASPVSLISVVCPNVSPSPTPSAGISPSSSPSAGVSPSSSPSAGVSPSSSPSAGVSRSPSPSPASPSASPSGVCSLVVTQLARSGSGGSWSDNSFRFQIYDITTTNNGTKPLTAASVTFNIAADQVITQFWNFVRVGATNTFTIPSFLLPAPGTSADGLGYVLRTPLNSTSDGSSIGAVTFAC